MDGHNLFNFSRIYILVGYIYKYIFLKIVFIIIKGTRLGPD